MAVRVLNTSNNLLRSQDRGQKSERCLKAQEIERLDGIQAGDSILCTNGVLWVTQAGDPGDYLLMKGGKFTANGNGMVLVQALEDAACRWYSNYVKSAALKDKS